MRCSLIFIAILISLVTMAQRNFNMELLSQVDQNGILTNDVWGYIDSAGTEYGIVGTRVDAAIYDLSDPSDPLEVARVPGASSIWRDFKTFGNFIFQTTDQGSDGLRIIDMTEAPDSVSSFTWSGPVFIDGDTLTFSRCHNLWIDDKGVAYLAGCNVGSGGVLMIDIVTDPYNPQFIAALDERYAHDVYVRDTLIFASEIIEGNLAIYNISEITEPKLISRTLTSSRFTHNAWLSDDANYIFTTDERPNSNVDAYDITNLAEPIRINTYSAKPGLGTVPHNAHYYKGYLVVSWYSEGIIILDAHRPNNLIRVAQYDTYPQDSSGGDGCWGAYPFFPSGLMIGSDIENGFFAFRPTYQRAAYLEGSILDFTSDAPINNASIQILDQDGTSDVSNATGAFKTGSIDTGQIEVVISHPDYITDTVVVDLQRGEVIDTTFYLRDSTDLVTSIVAIEAVNELKISPNPSSDFISINAPFEMREVHMITITDLNGRPLRLNNWKETEIDISNLSSGIYFLNIWTYQKKYCNKFVKL